MRYKCNEVYMARIPALSKQEFFKINNSLMKNLNYWNNENNIINESILVSSRSLFKSLKKFPVDDLKKMDKIKISLLKYLIRMSTRTTPYGLFSGVGLGEFRESTDIKIKNEIKSVKVDLYWMLHIIHALESDQKVIKKLKVKWNKLCYQSGDRMVNPYFSNHGDIYAEQDIIEEVSIKKSNLTKLIKNSCSEFTSISRIMDIIRINYKDVEKERVLGYLMDLVENEYLITELRIPSFCDEPLQYLIDHLYSIESEKDLLTKLLKIQMDITEYSKCEIGLGSDLLEKIYNSMSFIFNTENFLEINKGIIFENNTLSIELKDSLEKFMDTFSYLYCDSNDFSVCKKFVNKFSEEYGIGVEVPLINVIDPYGFNGLSLLESNIIRSNREKSIKSLIDNKILKSLLNNKGDEIEMRLEDFTKFINNDDETRLPKTFDMNFIIKIDPYNNYKITVGPIGGTYKAGMLFQRFKDVLDPMLFEKYLKIYKSELYLTENDYIIAEIRETITKGRVENVLNDFSNYNYCFNIACDDNKSKNIILELEDLYIGLDTNRKLYFWSKKYRQKVKFVTDNMLNPNLYSKLAYFLKMVSLTYEDNISSRLFNLYNNDYNYVPRILIEGVIVSPKTWKFRKSDFNLESFELFKENMDMLISDYQIEQYVFICDNDNRLVIDLRNVDFLKILFKEVKRKKELVLCEAFQDLISSEIPKDRLGKEYCLEISTSFLLQRADKQNKNSFTNYNKELCVSCRKLPLGKEGWVYFRLYGNPLRRDEVIKTYLLELIENARPLNMFFIRYKDEEEHLRIRLKYQSEEVAISSIKEIMLWFNNLEKKKLVNNIVFDTYNREINRYGGIELIECTEKFFCEDSIFVICLLKNFDIQNDVILEQLFFIGIMTIIMEFTNDLNEIFNIISVNTSKEKFRKTYQNKRKEYKENLLNILNENFLECSEYNDIINFYNSRKKALKNLRSLYDEVENTEILQMNLLPLFYL